MLKRHGNHVTDVSAKELEFLSNEAIEGEPLADRLAQGGLPAEEALRCAIDIGSALNRAHRRGAVHGKLSPHAILLTESGARIVRPVEGSCLDALAYRSPEQVSGEAADWRSDIFSFGTLLYEMASGRRAFSGEGAALDRAIREKPPAALMGKSPIHAAMEGVIAGCLEKDPGRRRQRVQNAVIELRLAGRGRLSTRPEATKARPAIEVVPPPEPHEPAGEDDGDIRPNRTRIFTPVRFPDEIQAVPGRPRPRRLLLWLLLVCAALLIASGAWILWQISHPAPGLVVQFPVDPPDNVSYRMPAVSPDGRYVVMQSAGPEGKTMLSLRALDTMTSNAIPGTEGGFAPFWSPDSQYVAFFAGRALRKVHLRDWKTEKICDAEPLPGGGTWNRTGTILFAPGQGTTLYRVSASGGTPQPLTGLNIARYEHAHLWPQFLPDGSHFVFFVLSDSQAATGVYTGSLDSGKYTLLFPSETNAVYSAPAGADSSKHGHLLYIRDRSLMTVGFDAGHLKLSAEPRVLKDDVGAVQSLSLAPLSTSETGTLVYQSVGPASRQLSWVDRSGKPLAPGTEGGSWGPPRISPDGTRAIAAKLGKDQKNADLWLIDQAGNIALFATGPAHKGSPVWSPDGSRIAYYCEMNGEYDLVVSASNPGSKAETLLQTAEPKSPTDWSRDGKFLFFGVATEGTRSDVWAISMTDRHAGPILDTIHAEDYAALSPDGKWLAFQSDDMGRNQVYVQPFDGITRGARRRYDISTDAGGAIPRWRADGKELFYMTKGGRMMSVEVYTQAEDFTNDPPQPLFQTRTIPDTYNLFDVAPDGQRFLMNIPLEWVDASPPTVVTNWSEKLKQ